MSIEHDHPAPVPVSIDVTPVPYPGGSTQAHFYRIAARRWMEARLMGSNATTSVTQTLLAIAAALEEAES